MTCPSSIETRARWRTADARRQAYQLMNKALVILDDAAVSPIAAAHLQGAIDSLELAKPELSVEDLQHPMASELLEQILSAGSRGLPDLIDQLNAPAYITDADGNVTYWNEQCIGFAGRVPEKGSDRWCVSWRLFTTAGEPLAHDDCPMAVSIREQRTVRGEIAIAERPDGRRMAFRPYPTPLFDDSGTLTGAVNMLIDVTAEHSLELERLAETCRRLARTTLSADDQAAMDRIAKQLEAEATALKAR